MGKAVLLIDDDPDIRLLVQMSLQLKGIEVKAFSKGQSGLDALESDCFSLIITDVMMPDMSGMEVLNRVVARYGDDAPPIALFTARPRETVVRELKEYPGVHILSKPFDPAQLAETVLSLMKDDK